MAVITGRTMGLLDRLFGFKAGAQSAPVEFSTESPIQPVFDVKRASEMGAVPFTPRMLGFFSLVALNAHGAGGPLVVEVSPYSFLDATFGVGSQDRYWVWLMQIAGLSSVNAALIPASNHATVSIRHIAQLGSIPTNEYPVAFFNSTEPDGLLTGAAFSLVNGGPAATNTQVNSPLLTQLPALVPPGATIGFGSNAAVAANIQANLLMWAGVIGSLPPGM